MERYVSLNRMTARILGAFVALSGTALASAPCSAPDYRVAETLVDKAGGVDVNVSIRLEDFAPQRLICLAGALKQAFPERSVRAFIFSSHEAALEFLPGDIDLPPGFAEYQYKLHGTYVYDRGKHEEYVTIAPDGHRQFDPALITRIDLPVVGTPTCRIGINGRCLLEFQHIYYPSQEHKETAFGRATLAGGIQPDGTMAGLSVVGAKVESPEQWSLLVNFAVKNLRTWRFEPGKHKDAVRITYRFERADSPPAGNGSGVQFRLPDEVLIHFVP
jgi:hypothetical protein